MIKVYVGNTASRQSYLYAEDTTLRAILEERNVDYTTSTISLDGNTLRPGDLDKTLAEHGITTVCYLMNVVKADNASDELKVKIIANTCVVVSGHKLEDYKTLAKHRPGALSLFEEDGDKKEEVFRVCVGKNNGSLNVNGAEFGSATAEDGKATITFAIPESVTEKKKEWIAEHYGAAIANLKKVENGISGAVSAVNAEVAEILQSISIA